MTVPDPALKKPCLLVASDLSVRSERAVERAALLAGELRTDLTILHVVDQQLPSHLSTVLMGETGRIIEGAAKSLRPSSVQIAIQVALGDPEEAVLSCADHLNAPLIVLGAHRKAEGGGAFRNSLADCLLRRGVRPVLIVKRKPVGAYEHILIAMDLSKPSRHALRVALQIFPAARFVIVHACHVPFKGFLPSPAHSDEVRRSLVRNLENIMNEESKSVMQRSSDAETRWSIVVDEGTPESIIHRQMAKSPPDLVVVGTHGHTGFRRFMIGSVAEQLLDTLPFDLLAVQPPESEQGIGRA